MAPAPEDVSRASRGSWSEGPAGRAGSPGTRSAVAIVHRGRGDAFRYRCLHLAEQLSLLGIGAEVVDLPFGDAVPLPPCRLLVIHRVPLDGFLTRQIEAVRRAGAAVLFDADDLVFEPDAAIAFARAVGEGTLVRALYRLDLEGQRAMLLAADAGLAATPHLAARMEAAGRTAHVHRNAFSAPMRDLAAEVLARRRRSPGERVVLGYASGTPTHDGDLAVVRPALEAVLERRPETELHLLGRVPPGGWQRFGDRVVHRSFVPWQELPSALASFDVNLAPLDARQPFSRAKSELKYVEAALVGVPTVASAAAAFPDAIEDGVTGLLADTTEAFARHLEALVGSRELRTRLGAAARDDVRARYSPECRAAELRGILTRVAPDLLERPAADVGTGERPPGPPASHLRRAIYALRYTGPSSFALRLLSFVLARRSRPGAS